MKPNAVLYRLEKILLYSIYENLSRSYYHDHTNDTETDETDFGKGYDAGYSDALEKLWSLIEEHNDLNSFNLRRDQ